MLKVWEHTIRRGKRFKNYESLLSEVGEERAQNVIDQIEGRPLHNHAVYTDIEGAIKDLMSPYCLEKGDGDLSWGWGPKHLNLKKFQWNLGVDEKKNIDAWARSIAGSTTSYRSVASIPFPLNAKELARRMRAEVLAKKKTEWISLSKSWDKSARELHDKVRATRRAIRLQLKNTDSRILVMRILYSFGSLR